MALWDTIGKKASAATGKAVQQAKNLAEVARLHGLVAEEEKTRDDAYLQIGKLYAASHADDAEPEYAGLIAQAAEAQRKIEVLGGQIRDMRGVTCCEKCGAEVPKDAAFCSACGAAIPKAKVVDGVCDDVVDTAAETAPAEPAAEVQEKPAAPETGDAE
ncbi:MAG: zinc ribbon domain-containing protein [Candidatus Faecousia sp.]|nr:zinc ribbon domain-containing protein [Candidatus Faecousia sp.]